MKTSVRFFMSPMLFKGIMCLIATGGSRELTEVKVGCSTTDRLSVARDSTEVEEWFGPPSEEDIWIGGGAVHQDTEKLCQCRGWWDEV